jgi:hypothetical protein
VNINQQIIEANIFKSGGVLIYVNKIPAILDKTND